MTTTTSRQELLSSSAASQPRRPETNIVNLRRVDPPRGSLVAYVDVRQPSGLEIFGCLLHAAGKRAWVNPPGMPKLDKDRRQLIAADGKPDYSHVIGFSGNHGVRSRWSRDIIAAIRRQYPEIALPTDDQEQEELGERWWRK